MYMYKGPPRLGIDEEVNGAVALFLREMERSTQTTPILQRTDVGKPFFASSDIVFSISHTKDLWACLFGVAQPQDYMGLEQECLGSAPPCSLGLDIQEKRPTNYLAVAKRFFAQEEMQIVLTTYKKDGAPGERTKDTFYRIWAAKEAYTKYLGCPLGRTIGQNIFSHLKEKKINLLIFDIAPDVVAAICGPFTGKEIPPLRSIVTEKTSRKETTA